MQFNEFLKKECVGGKCSIREFINFNNLAQSDVVRLSYTARVEALRVQRSADNHTAFNKATPLTQAAVLFAEAKIYNSLWFELVEALENAKN